MTAIVVKDSAFQMTSGKFPGVNPSPHWEALRCPCGTSQESSGVAILPSDVSSPGNSSFHTCHLTHLYDHASAATKDTFPELMAKYPSIAESGYSLPIVTTALIGLADIFRDRPIKHHVLVKWVQHRGVNSKKIGNHAQPS